MALELNRRWARLQLTAPSRLRTYRKIAKMLANGLPLLKVLEELELRASHEGRKPNESLAITLSDWRRVVQNGGMLSEAIDWWVPHTEQMIIMAGEQSGRLDSALTMVCTVVQYERRIRGAIVAGLAYPIAILSMTLGYLYLFGTLVIPRFASIVNPQRWHGVARSLYELSKFVQDDMLYCIGLAALLMVFFVYSLPRWSGRVRAFLDRYPPYSVYRLIVGCGFLVAFSSLQNAGFTVEKALARLALQARPWLQQRIDDVLFGVKSGLNVGEAMKNTGYRFPSEEIVDDLCIYAEYKGFADALQALADEWMHEGVERIETQMRAVNGAAIVTLALVLSWLITGFFGIQQEIAALARSLH
ncbi:type II secretion system protein F [Paraburkholderia sp. NMBU_R16]|uniref:type II secretion system F family protein n=1 Tax=Paraburkholderia sp. NMBU_R16 TaxID=2698676 RepID=UPI00156300F4|nr:type II secretion system F family protein [Paraburkholderia sp. NMBU_R16]NRO98854.1 type II secretion system protein F [Paraburkholderia sp. NMBU_R16]